MREMRLTFTDKEFRELRKTKAIQPGNHGWRYEIMVWARYFKKMKGGVRNGKETIKRNK